MAIKIICDRCGECINGNSYYTIDIRERDIRLDCTTIDIATSALTKNLRSPFDLNPCYCRQCVKSIENFVHNRSVKE